MKTSHTLLKVVAIASMVAIFGGSPIAPALRAADGNSDSWIQMFDGESLNGWKVTKENPDSFKVEDGKIVVKGERAHLFYETAEPFKDFEFEAEVMTKPNANSGIYFHTKYQPAGWPKYGYEAQVNATSGDPKKTASLYGVENLEKAPHKDNEWFKYTIRVEGRRITFKINDEVVLDHTEPEGKQPGSDFTRVLDQGTIGLQAHDPGSEVHFKNLRIRRLN